MSNPILKQAVVIGAGMGGLAAAKAVAPHFEKVTVFDRDALPDVPAPRFGTPQARHTHGLLAGGCRALEHLFPGIEFDLVEAGAVRMRVRRDTRFEIPASSLFRSATSVSINSACRAPRWSWSAVAASNASPIASSGRARVSRN